jgi:hypothetical protein
MVVADLLLRRNSNPLLAIGDTSRCSFSAHSSSQVLACKLAIWISHPRPLLVNVNNYIFGVLVKNWAELYNYLDYLEYDRFVVLSC